MVDSIGSSGGVPPVSNTNRASSRSETQRSESSGASAPTDEVTISAEAVELAQAEQAALQTAEQTRSLLEARIDEALSGENVAAALNALDVGE